MRFVGGRVCYKEYDEVMKMLSMQLLGMVIESLDVTDTAHFEQYSKEASGLLRWNYYPACPEPHKTLGMQVHTDFTLLTVLHLGDVGGLQVQSKSGHWLAVKPQPHAFAINIGDMTQVNASTPIHQPEIGSHTCNSTADSKTH